MGFCKNDGPNPVLTGLRFASIPQPQVETWGYYKFVPGLLVENLYGMPPSIKYPWILGYDLGNEEKFSTFRASETMSPGGTAS